MDKILVALIVLMAVAYLFRRFFITVKNKNAGCGCGPYIADCSQSTNSCESCTAADLQKRIPNQRY